MSNIKKYCIYMALYNVGFMFCSGAIIQTFLLQAGFTERQVYTFNSLIQLAQVVMMLIMTFLAGGIKRVKLVTGLSYLSLSVLAAVFLAGANNPSVLGQFYIIAVFITAGVCYVGVGLYTILAYCLPYYIIDMKEYGKMAALGVLCAGASSFALSFVHTFIVAKFSYMQAMSWFFVLAILCFVLTACTCLSLKEIEGQKGEVKTTKEDVISVFKNKDTYILLFPNFARGLAAGIMSVITVVATSMKLVDAQTSSYVNIVMQVAMFGGNTLYVMLYKKLSSRTLLFISTLGVTAFFPFCINGGLTWFLVAFFVAYFFRMIIDTAIPVVVTEIIPQNQIGAYTSIRMLVFTGAQAVATAVITPLVGLVGYTGLLIFASAMQFLCGIVYWWVATRSKRFFSDI